MSTLKEKFESKIAPALQKELGLDNIYQVPRLEKIVINCGIGRLVAGDEKKDQRDQVVAEVEKIITHIAGQKPRPNRARKSIAGFKLRAGELIGLSVTLRGQKMYDFLERFANTVLPRVRDFRGISLASVSPEGILNIGIKEHIVFPELMSEDFRRLYGVQITFVPKIKNRDQALALFKVLAIPFQK